MNWELVAFVFLGILILASAFRVITTSRIVHAALYLALCFTGVAGVFLLLGADFLAATQVLIYVGAVTTLVIFAIMLSSPPEVRGDEAAGGGPRAEGVRAERGWVGVLAALAAVGFVAAMGAIYRRAGLAATAAPLGHTTARLGGQIFTTYAVPFEVASVVLLAALVGAIYLSVRVPGGARGVGRPGGSSGTVGGARRGGEGGAHRGTP